MQVAATSDTDRTTSSRRVGGGIHVAMVTSYVTRVFLTALANYSHWEIETPHTQTSYTFRRTHSTFHVDLRRGPTVFALRMPNQSSGAGVEVGAPPPPELTGAFVNEQVDRSHLPLE